MKGPLPTQSQNFVNFCPLLAENAQRFQPPSEYSAFFFITGLLTCSPAHITQPNFATQ